MQPRAPSRLHLLALGLALVAACHVPAGRAAERAGDEFSIRGFGSLGMARSTNDDAQFTRDLSQPYGVKNQWSARIDSSLGVQGNWLASSSLELVGQVLSKYHADGSFKPELSLGFVKWSPDARTQIRAGRIGADFLMFADSRSIGYSYLPVRPPVEYFGQLFFSSMDGADLSLSFPLESQVMQTKLFAGRLQEQAPSALGIWDTSGSKIAGIILSTQLDALQLRGSVTSLRFSHDHDLAGFSQLLRQIGTTYGYDAALTAANGLGTKGTTSTYYSTGFVYDDGPLLLQGMFNYIHHQNDLFQNSTAAYLLAGYRVNSLTPYLGYSQVHSFYKARSSGLPDTAAFAAANAAFASLMVASTLHQRTFSSGVRWDLERNLALKLQWDAVRGNARSIFLVSHPSSSWNGKTDVFSVSLDFLF
jgi:hypothetical protein